MNGIPSPRGSRRAARGLARAAATSLALAAACGRGSTDGREDSKASEVALNVRLGWLTNANSVGQVAAVRRGFYSDEGLAVRLRDGGLVDPAVRTVAAGVDDLGFANSPDLVIAARSAGAPLRIVAVIQSQGLHAFFVRQDSAIRSPRDWAGRRVGVKTGSPTLLYYEEILAKLGIDRRAITEIPLGYDIRSFLAGEIDVYPGALNNEALAIEGLGVKLRYFLPQDFGIPTMGGVLFVNERTLQTRRGVVERFTRATLRGWEWCAQRENQETAVAYLLERNPRLDRQRELRAVRMAVSSFNSGAIDKPRLARMIEGQVRLRGLPRVTVQELTASLN